MKIKSILVTLTVAIAMFTGLSALIQDRLSRSFIDRTTATQAALIKTSALVDDIRGLQLGFKWQVQAFKDVVLRGRDPELLEKYRQEFEGNQAKVAAGIEGVSRQLQSAEYAPIAQTVKQLSAEHMAASAKYSEAIDQYMKLVGARSADHGLAADVSVRGIDRDLTADIDKVAFFVRQQNEANQAAAVTAAAQMRSEIETKLYVVAALLILALVIAGTYATRRVMSLLGAEPLLLRSVAEKISQGDLTATIPAHNLDDESSLASQLLLMQMKVRSLVIGIREETKGALDRARGGASTEDIVNDIRALSRSIRKFKTGASEEAA